MQPQRIIVIIIWASPNENGARFMLFELFFFIICFIFYFFEIYWAMGTLQHKVTPLKIAQMNTHWPPVLLCVLPTTSILMVILTCKVVYGYCADELPITFTPMSSVILFIL